MSPIYMSFGFSLRCANMASDVKPLASEFTDGSKDLESKGELEIRCSLTEVARTKRSP
jgi:hypothetical protein